jgi:exopolysaccharide/PEP-CTERM locus tyrosine autokinase
MSMIEKALEKMQAQARQGGARPGPGAPKAAASPAPFAGPMGTKPRADTVTVRPAPARGRILEINQVALRTAGVFPPEHQARSIAREYRQIKRPLIANMLGRGVPAVPNGNLLMVTSALAGEGKTFTSINLAFSLALEKDFQVVLVDADIPKPHISRLFGLSEEPGLLDLLQDSTRDVESLILPTSIDGLSVLPAGARSENATELLASDRMRKIVARIGEGGADRIVLFDSPPLLLTTESQALTHVVGQIVVVVRAGGTPQRAVVDALGHLGEHSQVSLLLNQSVTGPPLEYYYGDAGERQDGARHG